MQLLRAIDELENLIETSGGVMGRKMLDEEALFTKIQKIRAAIPREIKQADDILRNGSRVVERPLPATLENLTPDEKLRLIHQWSGELLEARR